eukprot:TRINITY_DN30266_c0_g1_i1.p1 TRINITY_DN30266_c0_g1~~TRINITY_DN30266_c0_g1_i1.p1  ORF type:complete len:545 (+),score=132.83 TRINITY_DN30266_c0_g1_i1:68-1636(+)
MKRPAPTPDIRSLLGASRGARTSWGPALKRRFSPEKSGTDVAAAAACFVLDLTDEDEDVSTAGRTTVAGDAGGPSEADHAGAPARGDARVAAAGDSCVAAAARVGSDSTTAAADAGAVVAANGAVGAGAGSDGTTAAAADAGAVATANGACRSALQSAPDAGVAAAGGAGRDSTAAAADAGAVAIASGACRSAAQSAPDAGAAAAGGARSESTIAAAADVGAAAADSSACRPASPQQQQQQVGKLRAWPGAKLLPPPASTARNAEAEALAAALDARRTPSASSSSSPVAQPARITYLTEDGRSWVIFVRRWRPSGAKEFAEQWALHPSSYRALSLYGKACSEQRYSQSWGVSYRYSGQVNEARPLSENRFVQELIDECNVLMPARGPYNGCLQNWYEPLHTISLHSDDERSLRRGSPIFSLSWGGPRRFLLRPRPPPASASPSATATPGAGGAGAGRRARPPAQQQQQEKKIEFLLQDGDLIVMGGTCQTTHRHEVPAVRKTMDPPARDRINWTIRAFAASA